MSEELRVQKVSLLEEILRAGSYNFYIPTHSLQPGTCAQETRAQDDGSLGVGQIVQVPHSKFQRQSNTYHGTTNTSKRLTILFYAITMKLIPDISLFAIFFMGSIAAYSQVLGNTDSLRKELLKQKDDTTRVKYSAT